jgi:hypothetical protein
LDAIEMVPLVAIKHLKVVSMTSAHGCSDQASGNIHWKCTETTIADDASFPPFEIVDLHSERWLERQDVSEHVCKACTRHFIFASSCGCLGLSWVAQAMECEFGKQAHAFFVCFCSRFAVDVDIWAPLLVRKVSDEKIVQESSRLVIGHGHTAPEHPR